MPTVRSGGKVWLQRYSMRELGVLTNSSVYKVVLDIRFHAFAKTHRPVHPKEWMQIVKKNKKNKKQNVKGSQDGMQTATMKLTTLQTYDTITLEMKKKGLDLSILPECCEIKDLKNDS